MSFTLVSFVFFLFGLYFVLFVLMGPMTLEGIEMFLFTQPHQKNVLLERNCYLKYMPNIYIYIFPNEVITSMVHLASYLLGSFTCNLKLLCQCQKTRATRKWYFHCQQAEINVYTIMVWERLHDKAYTIHYSMLFLKW